LLTFANNAQTTTSLSNGSNDIYLWSATADAAGAAKIKEFKLDVTMNGVDPTTTGDYELYVNGSKVTSTNVKVADNATLNRIVEVNNIGTGGITLSFDWKKASNVTGDTDADVVNTLYNDYFSGLDYYTVTTGSSYIKFTRTYNPYKKDEPTVSGSWTLSTNTTVVKPASYITVKFIGNYDNGYEVSAGSTVNFKLVATNIENAQTNDSITVRLNNNGTSVLRTTYGLAATHSVVWSDEADKATTTIATKDWFTDADLLSLPLNGETLTK